MRGKRNFERGRSVCRNPDDLPKSGWPELVQGGRRDQPVNLVLAFGLVFAGCALTDAVAVDDVTAARFVRDRRNSRRTRQPSSAARRTVNIVFRQFSSVRQNDQLIVIFRV